ncbi:MAG: helix-turn-helix domain-containing protein [Dokdonia sp.]|jgi:transcriptional regulator with XRE-family HTH domain|nr:transcriptional regulator [Cytophagaceae bacterium]
MVNKEAIAKRLKIICDEYDLSAAAFAEKIEVGRATISHILSGRNKPSLDFILKVTTAFPAVDLYWLLNGKGSFPKPTENLNQQNSMPPSNFDPDKNVTASSTPTFEKSQQQSPKIKKEITSSSEIERVIIFYKDGHFESFEH